MINYTIDGSIDSKVIYQNIIDNKKNQNSIDLLNSCKNNVFDDYGTYEKNKTNLEKIVPDSRIKQEEKDELIATYESKPAALRNALDKVNENMPLGLNGKCVYCQISEPNTFDHFLNKDRFPEYSIYVPNLMPCCTWCNSYKGAIPSIDSAGVQKFVHNIYDEMPKITYLFYDIEVKGRALAVKDIRLDFSEDPSNKINDILKRQYKKIHYIERLKKQFPGDIAAILIDFRDEILDESEVQSILNKKLQMSQRLFGLNHRNTAIYRGLVVNKAVITFMAKII